MSPHCLLSFPSRILCAHRTNSKTPLLLPRSAITREGRFTRGAFPPSTYYSDRVVTIATADAGAVVALASVAAAVARPSPADPDTGSYEFVDPRDAAFYQARLNCRQSNDRQSNDRTLPHAGRTRSEYDEGNCNPVQITATDSRVQGARLPESLLGRSGSYESHAHSGGDATPTDVSGRLRETTPIAAEYAPATTAMTSQQMHQQLDDIIGDLENEIVVIDRNLEKYHSG